MSSGEACNCKERKKPVEKRAWLVWDRCCNYSAFNGYSWTPSDYSAVYCPVCYRVWRTKAAYVGQLKDDKRYKYEPGRGL